jgi:hypothetical protein
MSQPIAFSDFQIQRLRMAAATLRVSSRDAFLQAVAHQLAHTRHAPTDRDVARAIQYRAGLSQ